MRLPIAIVLAAGLAGALIPIAARPHEHTATPAASKPQASAQRFATDVTLRREMQGVRAAVAALDHYEHGHMGPAQAAILASTIEGHVRAIIASCKLPPDADAALHTIIVPLLQNASALKQKPEDLSAIAPMRSALDQYDLQFYDPS